MSTITKVSPSYISFAQLLVTNN